MYKTDHSGQKLVELRGGEMGASCLQTNRLTGIVEFAKQLRKARVDIYTIKLLYTEDLYKLIYVQI